MKRLLNVIGKLLGLLALAALVVALAITLGRTQRSRENASQAFQSPIQTPSSPRSTPTSAPVPTATSVSIPQCAFPASAAQSAVSRGLIETYILSEPRVVLTHTSAIGIVGWLPDNQRLFITRLVRGEAREYIETLDLQTTELQRFGDRHDSRAKPVWLTAKQTVAFTDSAADKQVVLRVGRGRGIPAETVVAGLATTDLAVSPDGQRVAFFPRTNRQQPDVLDVPRNQRQSLPLILPFKSAQEMPSLGQQVGPDPYRAIWHPNGNQIAFYNDTSFYLADLPTRQLCEVNLGRRADGQRWAFEAQWSPNGRYLALLTTNGDPPVRSSDLTILNMVTGQQRSLQPDVPDRAVSPYVMDIAWAPNSQVLAILSTVSQEDGVLQQGTYLVDVATYETRRMLPQTTFAGGNAGWNLAWSPNGRQLAANCPTVSEGRLCIVEVSAGH